MTPDDTDRLAGPVPNRATCCPPGTGQRDRQRRHPRGPPWTPSRGHGASSLLCPTCGRRWLPGRRHLRSLAHAPGQASEIRNPVHHGRPIVESLAVGEAFRLWDVDPATTDAERAEWGVPPLAVAREQATTIGQAPPPTRLG